MSVTEKNIYMKYCKYDEESKKVILELINTIETQQKELDKLKNKNKELLRKLKNRVKETKKLQKYSLYKKEFSRLNKELGKKDMIIDLMAKQLEKDTEWYYSKFDDYTKDDFKKYFEKKVNKDGRN